MLFSMSTIIIQKYSTCIVHPQWTGMESVFSGSKDCLFCQEYSLDMVLSILRCQLLNILNYTDPVQLFKKLF